MSSDFLDEIMSELFSMPWMKVYQAIWNENSELSQSLAKIDFSTIVAYGMLKEAQPRSIMEVKSGQIIRVTPFEQQILLQWDIRSDEKYWQQWFANPPGMMTLGMAVATGKLRFVLGNYEQMLKNPTLAGAFMRMFAIMAQVERAM